MKKSKFYVVWEGRKVGVFDKWDVCKKQIDAFEGAKYRSYPTLQEAQKALDGGLSSYYNGIANKGKVNILDLSEVEKNSIAVDAACSGNPGDMEYRGVYVKTGEELFRSRVYMQGTNNIGEFLALVHGLAMLKKEESNLPIYSDSMNAIAWVKNKKCKTKLAKTTMNSELFEMIDRAEAWLKVNSWANRIIKWETQSWGEIPADFGRK